MSTPDLGQTPIIVRNLLLGCETFGEIAAGAPGMSETLLSQRLRTLEQHGIIDRSPNPRGRGPGDVRDLLGAGHPSSTGVGAGS